MGRILNKCFAFSSLALLALASIWIFAYFSVGSEYRHAQQAIDIRLRDALKTYEADLKISLSDIDQTLSQIVSSLHIDNRVKETGQIGRHDFWAPGIILQTMVVDQNGEVIASYPYSQSVSVAADGYFSFHRQHDSASTFVGHTSPNSIGARWNLQFSRRLNDRQGKFSGVAVIDADAMKFTSSYERGVMGDLGLLGVLGDDGVMYSLRIGDKRLYDKKIFDLQKNEAYDGVYRHIVTRKLPGLALTMVVGLADVEAMANYEKYRASRYGQAWTATMGLLIGIVLYVFWRWQDARNRAYIHSAQETYAAASAASLDAFFVLRELRDSNGNIVDFSFVDVNSQAEKITGLSKSELATMTLCELIPAGRENGMFDHLVHITEVGGVHEKEWESKSPLFGARWLHQQVVPVKNGLVAIVRDISERKLAEARLAHLAHHDTLTGLPNRTLIAERLEQKIGDAKRLGGSVAVAFIDLDGFKLVNDGLGHNAGDDLLRAVSERMKKCLRFEDVVGRFGGDEFVLILNDRDESNSFKTVLERVREAIFESITLRDQEVHVSCSVGVSVYPCDGDNVEALLMHADTAMYLAKESGKNNCQFFTRGMDVHVEGKLALLEGLRGALNKNEFSLVYQPMIDSRTNLICGLEALVRWEHSEQGQIGPDRFIPLAEESGLITEIGGWVLRTACIQNRLWQDEGFPPVRIAVNVSPRQFEDPQFVQRVIRALEQSQLAPEWLELEVTEGVIMRDIPQAISKMTALRSLGVGLSIDDFGTGYSSVWALKTFPVSTLKIDKCFVRDVEWSEDDQAIASSIIELAHRLNLRVVAEGVESGEQHSFLTKNGCDEMQGYHFSKPVPPIQLQKLLVSQNSLKDLSEIRLSAAA